MKLDRGSLCMCDVHDWNMNWDFHLVIFNTPSSADQHTHRHLNKWQFEMWQGSFLIWEQSKCHKNYMCSIQTHAGLHGYISEDFSNTRKHKLRGFHYFTSLFHAIYLLAAQSFSSRHSPKHERPTVHQNAQNHLRVSGAMTNFREQPSELSAEVVAANSSTMDIKLFIKSRHVHQTLSK